MTPEERRALARKAARARWGKVRKRFCVLLTLATTSLVGCATSNIVMKNPRTDQIQVCQRPPFGEVRAAEKCAEALEHDGWIRLR